MAKYSPRAMRRDLLSDDTFPPKRIAFHLSDHVPYQHAAFAADLKKSAEEVRERLGEPDHRNDAQLHQDLDAAMATAAEAAEQAFETALAAAWKWYWLLSTCDCPSCRLRNQRASAPLN